MNCLQLYITRATREFAFITDINGTAAGRRRMSDISDVVSAVGYQPTEKNIFYAIENSDGGYFIHVVRTIPPTRPWHLDAAIFVPANLDVLAEDLDEVIATVTDTVLASSVSEESMAELTELFSHEYDLRDKTPKIKPSAADAPLAYITYGSTDVPEFADLLDNGLYRPEWSAFSYVLLIDSSMEVTDPTAVDLLAPKPAKPEKKRRQQKAPRPEPEEKGPESHNYLLAIPMMTPDGRTTLEFEVQSSRAMKRCPISGYEFSRRPNENEDEPVMLRRSHGEGLYGRFGRYLWGLGGLVAGILIMMIISAFGGSKSSDAENIVAGQSSESVVVPAPSAATAYLDENKIWIREDMENISGLEGLYDDMNNYRFDRITGVWAEKLSGSKSFAKVVRAARQSVGKHVDPRRDPAHNPTYIINGSTQFSWKPYTFWIDP